LKKGIEGGVARGVRGGKYLVGKSEKLETEGYGGPGREVLGKGTRWRMDRISPTKLVGEE